MSDGLQKGRVGAAVGGQQVGGGWRALFRVAAAFNFVVGALGMLSPEATIDARIIGVLVFCFGIVYWQVAREPLRYAPILWAGVIGKLGVVGLLGPTVIGSEGDTVIVAILALDALFAIAFLAFLLTKGDTTD